MNTYTKLYYVVVGWGYTNEYTDLETVSLEHAEKRCHYINDDLTEDEFDAGEQRAHVLVENDEGTLVEHGFEWL
jgi:hypothetical protein